jgi:hypothetical protein
MKKYPVWIFLILFFFFFLAFPGFAGEKIELGVAKRAAEYHGELIFEKDLRICDHELMFWPSGEEAVYVFTLMAEKEVYPEDVFFNDEALQGAYLALSGQFDEGYNLMAQPDQFKTVVVGATTDMPSFLKAHAGLPEYLLYLKLMENPPYDPYFIYIDLFHTCVGSKLDRSYPYSNVTEIHLKKTVSLSDLSTAKTGHIPDYALEYEWGSFLNPGQIQEPAAPPYFIDHVAVKEGKHQLDVKEYALASTAGCSPAAFVNCLKYLEEQGKVKTQGKSIGELLEWTAICFRTDPADKSTMQGWIKKGSNQMFKGLGYRTAVSAVMRQDSKPGLFLTKFAREINTNYPVELGGTGKGIFEGHSTTGIGYWKQGTHIRLIVHDGWAGNNPVIVKYSGYPAADCQYPRSMNKFHPKGATNYPKANPKIKAPKIVMWDKTNLCWYWEYTLESNNKVKVECYKRDLEFFDSKGNRYWEEKYTREIPYFIFNVELFPRNLIIRGKVLTKSYIVDDNGHLLEAKNTLRLEDIIGTWKMNYRWTAYIGGSVIWTVKKNGIFTTSDGYNGTWDLNKRKVKFNYQSGTIYSGKVNLEYSDMSGTMRMTTGAAGTWDATRQSDGLSPADKKEMPKMPGSCSDSAVKKE